VVGDGCDPVQEGERIRAALGDEERDELLAEKIDRILHVHERSIEGA